MLHLYHDETPTDVDTLKSMFPTEQPNFETIAIEAAHEDGEQNG